MKNDKINYADDKKESVWTLFKLRTPALFLGLILGIGLSFISSSFEEVLSKNVEVAFFIPFVVYISSALGAQTEAIYIRDLKTEKVKFSDFLYKEIFLGLLFGTIFGLFSGLIVLLWLHNTLLALSITLSSFMALASAPIVALTITQFFQTFRQDPATGTGPIATVIQDIISILIYGLVCSWILL